MVIKPGIKSTTLGTGLTFKVRDHRGTYGFPGDQCGFVFRYDHPIPDTSRMEVYTIQADIDRDWHVNYTPWTGPKEVVCGPHEESYWSTNEAAARALEWYLKSRG